MVDRWQWWSWRWHACPALGDRMAPCTCVLSTTTGAVKGPPVYIELERPPLLVT